MLEVNRVGKAKKEMTSLEVHEEMYKRRLEELKLRKGRSIKELLNIANNPKYYRRVRKETI
jgi:hypothetical protein